MSDYQQNAPAGKDAVLWAIAQKRASFKNHAFVYTVINIFLWGMWFFNQRNYGSGYPWPMFTTIGWGIGLTFHFLGAYVFPKANSVEREYEKLKNKIN